MSMQLTNHSLAGTMIQQLNAALDVCSLIAKSADLGPSGLDPITNRVLKEATGLP
jgi:hypothetical protein